MSLAWFSVEVMVCAFSKGINTVRLSKCLFLYIDAAYGENLFINITIRGVDEYTYRITNPQSVLLGERQTDEDTLAIIGGWKLSADEAFTIRGVCWRLVQHP